MRKMDEFMEHVRRELPPDEAGRIQVSARQLEEEYCSQIKPLMGQDDCTGLCDACSELRANLKRLQANVALEV